MSRALFVMAIYAMVRDPGDLWLVLGLNALSQFAAATAEWRMARRLDIGLLRVPLAECGAALPRSFFFMLSERWRRAIRARRRRASDGRSRASGGRAVRGRRANLSRTSGAGSASHQALLPLMSSQGDLVLFRRLFWLIVTLALVTAIACGMPAGPLMTLICGPGFVEAGRLLPIFMLVLVIYVPGVLLGYPLAVLDRAAVANCSLLWAGAAQLILVAILFATDGLAAATLITSMPAAELVVLVTRLRWAWLLTGRPGNPDPATMRQPFNCSLGITIAGVLTLFGALPLLGGEPARPSLLFASAGLIAVAVLLPVLLTWPNRAFAWLGRALQRVVNPLILPVLSAFVVVPAALIGRLGSKGQAVAPKGSL